MAKVSAIRVRGHCMSLKFRDEEERQELVRLHAEVYRRARHGDITLDELVRLSRTLFEHYRKGLKPAKNGTIAAQEDDE